MVACPTNRFDWSTTFGQRYSPLSGTATQSPGMFTLYVHMWQICRCQRPSWPVLQEHHSMVNDVIWRAVKRPTFLLTKNQRVLFYRMVKNWMELYHGLGTKHWRGTSLFLTHMRHRTCSQHLSNHAAQPSMQQGQRSPNTMSWALHVSSIQCQFKQLDLGTHKQWSWKKKVVDVWHWKWTIRMRRCIYFKGSQLLFKSGMHCHSPVHSTLITRNQSLQSLQFLYYIIIFS